MGPLCQKNTSQELCNTAPESLNKIVTRHNTEREDTCMQANSYKGSAESGATDTYLSS